MSRRSRITLVALAASLLAGCAGPAAKPEAAAVARAADPSKAVPPTVDALDVASLSAEDRIGLTVHFARIGDLKALQKMLDAGVDVNGRDSLDQTPLIAAVSQDSTVAVRELLKRGARLDAVDKAGWTPLHFATYFSDATEVMGLLLEAGASVDARNDRGITPLYFAAGTGHVAQVQLLLARGADRRLASNSGWTPLRIAQVKGIEPVARLLDPDGKGDGSPEPAGYQAAQAQAQAQLAAARAAEAARPAGGAPVDAAAAPAAVP
jgi:ankyrin repeat protein